MRWLNALTWLARLGLAGVWVYAGGMKMQDVPAFAQEIAAYQIVTVDVADVVAPYLPWLEIVVGIGLLVPAVARGAVVLTTGMLMVFTLALLSAWWRGLDVTCGCFGAETASQNLVIPIVRDVVLLAVAAWVGYRLASEGAETSRGSCPTPAPSPPRHLP